MLLNEPDSSIVGTREKNSTGARISNPDQNPDRTRIYTELNQTIEQGSDKTRIGSVSYQMMGNESDLE